jgi:hypothetical protein
MLGYSWVTSQRNKEFAKAYFKIYFGEDINIYSGGFPHLRYFLYVNEALESVRNALLVKAYSLKSSSFYKYNSDSLKM